MGGRGWKAPIPPRPTEPPKPPRRQQQQQQQQQPLDADDDKTCFCSEKREGGWRRRRPQVEEKEEKEGVPKSKGFWGGRLAGTGEEGGGLDLRLWYAALSLSLSFNVVLYYRVSEESQQQQQLRASFISCVRVRSCVVVVVVVVCLSGLHTVLYVVGRLRASLALSEHGACALYCCNRD